MTSKEETGGGVVVPGDLVGSRNECKVGRGVYSFQRQEIRSALIGNPIRENREKEPEVEKSKKDRMNVIPLDNRKVAKDFVLNVGDQIYGRVVRSNYNQVYIDIIAIGDFSTPFVLKGVIRREDIRETEIDKVVVQDHFKAFDIVRAVVISLGDSKYYFLSTAKPELGVVLPKSKDKFL